jgi:replicative superfamily II helicase
MPSKHIITLIQTIIDENKEYIQDQDYIDICNFLKENYEEEDTDEEDHYQVFRVVIRNELFDFLDMNISQHNRFIEFVLHNNLLINEEEDDIDFVSQQINNQMIFHLLETMSIDKIKELIQRLGGEDECIKKIKIYKKNNKRFIKKVENKDYENIEDYYRCLVFYGLDRNLMELEYLENGLGYSPSTFLNKIELLTE